MLPRFFTRKLSRVRVVRNRGDEVILWGQLAIAFARARSAYLLFIIPEISVSRKERDPTLSGNLYYSVFTFHLSLIIDPLLFIIYHFPLLRPLLLDDGGAFRAPADGLEEDAAAH